MEAVPRGAPGLSWKGVLSLALLLVTGAAAAFAWWRLQVPPERILTIGAFHLTEVDAATFEGFKAGMRERGYTEGENVRYRYLGAAGGVSRLEPMLVDLLASHVDLIFVSSTPATLAVKRATADRPIPVVFAPVNDPVGAGIVASLRAPGGNFTGIRLPQGDAMRLQWLKRLAPKVRRVLVPFNPRDESALESLRQVEDAAAVLGLQLLAQPVTDPRTIARHAEQWTTGADAIFLPRDSVIESHVGSFVAAARTRRLPLCAPSLTQVEAGALLSYGFVHREIGHQAARLADQILRGMSPADLPVETAGSYLAINLKTARAIGIDPPDEVLRQVQVLIR